MGAQPPLHYLANNSSSKHQDLCLVRSQGGCLAHQHQVQHHLGLAQGLVQEVLCLDRVHLVKRYYILRQSLLIYLQVT